MHKVLCDIRSHLQKILLFFVFRAKDPNQDLKPRKIRGFAKTRRNNHFFVQISPNVTVVTEMKLLLK